MDLNLSSLSKNSIPSLEEEHRELFKEVNLVLLATAGLELHWTYPIGESLQTILLRLTREHGFGPCKLYLEEKNEANYMLDPLSLNDFPRVKELAAAKQPVKILVEGVVRRVSDLNLTPLSERRVPSLHEETQALFEDVTVEVVTSTEEFSWTFPIGESVQTLISRLQQEHGYGPLRLYFEDESGERQHMLDPLSLNDFPKLVAAAKAGKTITIVCDGQKLTSINLTAVQKESRAYEEENHALWKNVTLSLQTKKGELKWTYPLGESIATLVLRLVQEVGYKSSPKLYLETKSDGTYMLDPLSLNDFPKVKELAAANGVVSILVEGSLND